MKWYRVSKYSIEIVECEASSETNKTLVFGKRREMKCGTSYEYFRSWEEARANLIDRVAAEIERRTSSLERARAELIRAKSLEHADAAPPTLPASGDLKL